MKSKHKLGLIVIALAAVSLAAAPKDSSMSYTYAGTDNYPQEITLPQGSDLKNVSTVDVPFEGLADRTEFLAKRSWGGYSARFYPPFVAHNITGAARFGWAITSVGDGWLQTDVTDAGGLVIPVHTPPRGELSLIRLYVVCATVRGAVPATKPIVTLYSNTPEDDQPATLHKTATDPSTLAADYQAAHYIELVLTGGDLVVIDQETLKRTLWLHVTGETGANSAANSLVIKGYSTDYLAL